MSLDAGLQKQNRSLRVVIAYNNFAAGRRAMGVLANLGEQLGAGFDFFAPASRHKKKAITRIHQRVEVVTPVREKILGHHRSAPRKNHNARPS